MICSFCDKDFTAEDIEKDRLMRVPNIPGYVHKKCKADFDITTIGNATPESLEREKDILLGDK